MFNILSLDNQNIFLTKYGKIKITVGIPLPQTQQDLLVIQNVDNANFYMYKQVEKLKKCQCYEEYQDVVYDILTHPLYDIDFSFDNWYYNRKEGKYYSGVGNDNKREKAL